MLKRRKRSPLERLMAVGAGVAVIATGVTVASFKFPQLRSTFSVMAPSDATPSLTALDADPFQDSALLPLIPQAPAQRAEVLTAIASQSQASRDRHRARYLLASDLIQEGQPAEALRWLENLEQDYSVLAPHVVYQRARAYEALNDKARAEDTWNHLLNRYSNEPVAVEALFSLAQGDPSSEYWDRAIAEFPAYPRTVEMAQIRLQKNPDQPQLLLLLARHGLYLPNIVSILSRLTEEYASELQPEDWAAIAFAYWENQQYGSAGLAYAKAPETPLHLYRAARGAHLANRDGEARQRYAALNERFPEDRNTAQGLLHLASLTQNSQAALQYLDAVIERFPDRAADALIARAKRLDALQSPQSAVQARESVLTQYSTSDAAADLRWQQIERRVSNGDIRGAWEWAKQLVDDNPDSRYAPQAAFWVAKWAQEIGHSKESQQALEYVLARYPQSYYAWRAATLLGWDVGDFNSVRQKMPDVQTDRLYIPLSAGSDTTQELHNLGRHWDAWARWQVEFEARMQPSVAEQYTDGVLRLGVGDNLEGLFMLESLAWREDPADQAEFQALKRSEAYWKAVYPLLYAAPIQAWSTQRQLNPMLVSALIRQESRFEPRIRSVVGAVGLMQVMPDTAEWISTQTAVKPFNLENPEDNIKLGTWYLDYTHREYGNNSLFAIASYNAGPNAVADWVVRFGARDPDKFVTQIPFPETQGYVEAVFENYWNYLRLYNPQVSRQFARFTSPERAIAWGESVND
jgi:soluble lytic murein transglycosylase